MTLETSTADAAPTRRSRRRPVTSVTADQGRISSDVAELSEPTPSVAEAVVAAGATVWARATTTAAVDGTTVAAQPTTVATADVPLTRAELRRRRAAALASATDVETVAATPTGTTRHPAVSGTFAGTAAQPGPEPCAVEDFDFSAQLFSFTGETPVQVAAAALADEAEAEAAASDVAPRRRRLSGKAAFRRIAGVSFSVSVMGAVGLLAIGVTTPASVVAAMADTSADIAVVAPSSTTSITADEIQAYVAASDVTAGSLERTETYDIASMADIAADSGVTQFAGTWVNDPAADIQWPFPVGVPVSAAFGSASYLAQFSSPHRGVDLAPGTGAEVHVIADGTVRLATEGGGDYGVNVVVDHVIDGQLVSTRYAHMQYGSLRVSAGDTVSVGDVLGTVGSTGKATGPHLHFEVLLGGTARVDPYTWMQQHTTS